MSRDKGTAKPKSKTFQAISEQLKRQRGIRDLPARFLIVCEDGKSAPKYFEALKKHFNLSAASVHVVPGDDHTQPIQVVTRAIAIKKNAAEPDSGTEPFAHVWCVIDGDFGHKIHNARRRAKANGIELAITTKCFEYWLLLHFEEDDKATTDCATLVRSLKRHIPKYEKGKCEFGGVVDRVREATRRAEKLRKPGISRGEAPEDQNPCSEIYRLIHAILDEIPA